MLKVATEEHKTLVDWSLEQSCDKGKLCWLDLQQPSPEELSLVAKLTGVSESLLDAAADTETVVHSEAEDDWLLLVSRALDYSTKRFSPQHLGILVGRQWLISIHESAIPETEEALRDWRVEPTKTGADLVNYLMDAILDRMFPLLDDIEDKLYAVEENIVAGGNIQKTVLNEILSISRQLLSIRKVGGALRDTANDIFRLTPKQDDAWSQFQEVYHHSSRVVELAEMLHELSSSTIEAHLATVSNQLNSVMKTLTIWATILMSLSLISGIFGMNFAFPAAIKEQSLRGFWTIMAAMTVTIAGLLYWFRRMRFLN